MTERITPAEVRAIIEGATGLKLQTRRLLYWAGSGSFPAPSVRVNAKTIYWTRDDVMGWIEKHFGGDDSQHKPEVRRGARP